MSTHEEMMNLGEEVVGDIPNTEAFEAFPEAHAALEHINNALENIDQKGRETYGGENWDLLNAK